MTSETPKLCGDERMHALLAEADADSTRGVAAIEAVLTEFPDDPRLHFLKGSLLVGLSQFIEAHAAMSRALALAPDFAIARFQLGFFELTSGEAEAALATWAPLDDSLPPDHYLRRFVAGLRHLIADRFAPCIADLRAGIAANAENLPLNQDMELIVAKCEELLDQDPGPGNGGDESDDVSATSFLLGTGRR